MRAIKRNQKKIKNKIMKLNLNWEKNHFYNLQNQVVKVIFKLD